MWSSSDHADDIPIHICTYSYINIHSGLACPNVAAELKYGVSIHLCAFSYLPVHLVHRRSGTLRGISVLNRCNHKLWLY